jgi:hypothetical protein
VSNDSDSPSLQASVTPGTVRLGDLITLSVQATHPPGVLVEPPAFQKELGTFEVYASTALPVQAGSGLEVQRFEIQLQNFTTGQQLLPGIGFTYRDAKNQVRTLKTPEMKVMVEMLPPGPKDKGDIRGIKGVLGPVGISPLWWFLLLFALIVGAAAWWSQRRRKQQGPPPAPPVPPDKRARDQLNELLASGFLESGKIKEFHSALSDIVRAYIEMGFDCPALERTTNELMRDLRQRAVFPSETLLSLKTWLEDNDLVKFAKFRPSAEESLKAHAIAVQFIEKTKALLKAPSPAESGRGK